MTALSKTPNKRAAQHGRSDSERAAMRDLTRALRMSLRYKYSLIASIACSAMVAIFWGANIGAVYPFVEVVFQGRTLEDWVDHELAKPPTDKTPVAKQSWEKRQERLKVTRKYIVRYAPADPFATLGWIVLFLLFGTVLKCTFRILSLMLVSRVSGRTTADIRKAFFRALLSDDGQSLERAGDAAARVGGDVGAIGASIQTIFGKSVQEPLKMAACLMGAAAINWRLLLFSMLACPLASLLLLGLAKSIRRASLRAFDHKCMLMNRMLQTFQGLEVVKAYNMESHERRRFWDHTMKVYREQMKIGFYGGLIRANNELLGIGIVSLSVLAGGYLVLNQQTHLWGIRLATNPMNFGQIMLFFALLIGCSDPLRKIADVYGTIQGGAAAAQRIMPFLDRPAAGDQAHRRETIRISSARRPITFRNVDFQYVEGRPVLRGVTFEIRVGETLAVVGPNGSGKTTLINLLLRFRDPTKGTILLGDTNVLDIRKRDIRRRTALVTQHPVLFGSTVYENIRYGSRQATREMVIEAARRAHAHEFIVNDLPRGYDTHCGDGGRNLSGGQRQRIALARAILRDPDLLILDEAASQIDPQSEQLLRKSLRDFAIARTTLMITHRMHNLDLADRIVVFDAGCIVDIGTHDELIRRCPLYQALRLSPNRKVA